VATSKKSISVTILLLDALQMNLARGAHAWQSSM